MGMSVSFAIQNRYKKGDNTLQVVAHIFWRTVALIAMGLFSLNSGGIEGGLSHQWFSILMVIGFFLTWGVYPKAVGTKKVLFTAMKTAGVLLLAFLVIYKDMNGKPFQISWWGIPAGRMRYVQASIYSLGRTCGRMPLPGSWSYCLP